jgi:hypothetical protein
MAQFIRFQDLPEPTRRAFLVLLFGTLASNSMPLLYAQDEGGNVESATQGGSTQTSAGLYSDFGLAENGSGELACFALPSAEFSTNSSYYVDPLERALQLAAGLPGNYSDLSAKLTAPGKGLTLDPDSTTRGGSEGGGVLLLDEWLRVEPTRSATVFKNAVSLDLDPTDKTEAFRIPMLSLTTKRWHVNVDYYNISGPNIFGFGVSLSPSTVKGEAEGYLQFTSTNAMTHFEIGASAFHLSRGINMSAGPGYQRFIEGQEFHSLEEKIYNTFAPPDPFAYQF